MKLSPTQFESLVVKLLLAMGYGDGTENAGRVTQQTNDGGIDGIIKEDKLGFSNLYIQAKQWATDHTVGRGELQKFVMMLKRIRLQKITLQAYRRRGYDQLKNFFFNSDKSFLSFEVIIISLRRSGLLL